MPSTAPAHRPALLRTGSSAVLDLVLALALLGTTVVLLSHGGLKSLRAGSGDGAADLDVVTLALAAVSTLPVVAARRWPLGAYVVAAAGSVGLAAHGDAHDLPLGAAVALFLLAAHRVPAGPAPVGAAAGHAAEVPVAAVAVAVAGSFVAYLVAAGLAQDTPPVPELLHTALAGAAAWFAGERTRLRHDHVVQLHERAVRAEREAEGERRLAAAEERARIARDLHDSAGHAINVIAVRAGAARLRHLGDPDPDRSLQALEAIEELARQTAADIDHIVGTLRDAAAAGNGDGNGATVEAPPGLASLGTLVARHTAAGLDVAVASSGTVRPLSDPADQGAYRILQEALTNAARHGTGRARVGVAYGERDLEITVTNPVGPTATDAHPDHGRRGGGHGLVGMRERAALLGGRLDAERVDGSFRLRASIPYSCPGGAVIR